MTVHTLREGRGQGSATDAMEDFGDLYLVSFSKKKWMFFIIP